MPVHKCPNGKWRIGRGDCIYTTEEKANEAYRAYLAQTYGKEFGKMPVQLKNIVISFISLVKAGANNRKILIKAIDGEPSIEFQAPIIKIDEDGRRFYSVVYAPNEEDLQGEFASADDIQKAAYDFMKNLRAVNIDKNHSFENEQAFVAESWLIRKDDPLFPEEKEGSWAVGIIVEDDDVWKEILDGKIEAVSMGGIADKVQDQFIEKAVEETESEYRIRIKSPSLFQADSFRYKSISSEKGGISLVIGKLKGQSTTTAQAVRFKKKTDGGAGWTKSEAQAWWNDHKASLNKFVIPDQLEFDFEELQDETFLAKVFKEVLHKLTKKGGNEDMKKEEVQEMIDESIKKALKEAPKPLSKEDMTEVVKVALKPTVDRITELEKTSKGSRQGDDDITGDSDLEAIGTDIAKAINEK